MSENARVALEKCADYNEDTVYKAVEHLMELVPPPDVRGKVVLVKPNMLSPKKPEAAVCTHPAVVEAVVRAFVARGAKQVIAGESPATANSMLAAKMVGTYDAVVKGGGEWDAFDDSVPVNFPEGKLVKSFEFAAPFQKADIIVSVAKLKTHQLMAYTGAMKNLFGLMVGLKKAQTHFRFPDRRDFSEFLVDLNAAAGAEYAVMDAVVGMEGPGGPGNGDPVQLGFLAASTNILALDWICSGIVGYKQDEVPYLHAAMERGLWLKSADEIETAGVPPDELKPEKFRIVRNPKGLKQAHIVPNAVYNFGKLIWTKSPHFIVKKCINCGRCIEICPAHILSFEPLAGSTKKRVVITRSKCLHCYCCHEICPVEAIKLRIL